MAQNDGKPDVVQWLGLDRRPDLSRARPLGVLIGGLLLLLGAILLGATIWQFVRAVLEIDPFVSAAEKHAAIRNTGVVLIALLGAPFVIWRTWVASKQASIAAESLFNDKISAATHDLAARRQVTTVLDQKTVVTEWQDDLVTRNAAIDRLEGLAQERPDAAGRIASQLSVYVSELSTEYPAQKPPKNASPDRRKWADGLTRARSDMEKATQTLGRLQSIPGTGDIGPRIDLRRANLQGFELNRLSFRKAKLQAAMLQGAHLLNANLQDANISRAELQGAYLVEAKLRGANFTSAKLQGVNFLAAELDRKTSFTDADLGGATVERVVWKTAALSQDQLNSMFGDDSVQLPHDLTRPNHWPDGFLNFDKFQEEYELWQADPASYKPPQDRS